MKVWILSKGGGGGRTPNLNFWFFILVALLNLVTEKFNPIFGLNFRGEGVNPSTQDQPTAADAAIIVYSIIKLQT